MAQAASLLAKTVALLILSAVVKGVSCDDLVRCLLFRDNLTHYQQHDDGVAQVEVGRVDAAEQSSTYRLVGRHGQPLGIVWTVIVRGDGFQVSNCNNLPEDALDVHIEEAIENMLGPERRDMRLGSSSGQSSYMGEAWLPTYSIRLWWVSEVRSRRQSQSEKRIDVVEVEEEHHKIVCMSRKSADRRTY